MKTSYRAAAILAALLAFVSKAPAQDDHGVMAGMDHHAKPTALAHQAEPTIRIEVAPATGVAVGAKTDFTIDLNSKEGKPVTLDDLALVHTEKLHLLIVDPSLTDYRHEHPTATDVPGRYAFSMTPNLPGEYKVFADLVPTATGEQEYAATTISVPGSASPVARTTNTETTVDGYKVSVAFEKPELKVGEASEMTLTVTGPDGKPFAGLEPIMGAYAHLVAFGEDRDHVAHAHPMDAGPAKDSDRGGPSLKFHLQFPEAGYQKLFAQFRIGGKDVFAPFGLEVKSGELQLADNTVCPVSGDEVGSMEEGAHVDYKGVRVGLCCSGCVKKFMADPDANLAKALKGSM